MNKINPNLRFDQLYLILNNIYENNEEIKNFNEFVNKINEIKIKYDEYEQKKITDIMNKISHDFSENEENNNVSRIKQRTDNDLISEINLIEDSLSLFKKIIYEENKSNLNLDYHFLNKHCEEINQSIKDKFNPYTLDKYGLVIRRKKYNKKQIFGWKFDDDMEPIHFLSKPNICTFEENVQAVLNYQFRNNPKLFQPGGLIYKIYQNTYPERLEMFNQ